MGAPNTIQWRPVENYAVPRKTRPGAPTRRHRLRQIFPRSVFARATAIICALIVSTFAGAAAPETALRPINHVFLIVLENQNYSSIYSPNTQAPYLGLELPKIGVLLTNYYAIGHASLD